MAKEKSYGLVPYIIISGKFFILLNKTSEESYYNFFKGKIEKNETIKKCAQREFQEETGIKVDYKDFESYYFQSNTRKNIGIFLVDWTKYNNKNFHFQKREIYSATWVELNYDIEISKNQKNILNDINLDFEPRKYQISRLYK